MEIYGDVFVLGERHRSGARAECEYAEQGANVFFVIPFLGDVGGPHGIAKSGPGWAAYQCSGPLIPLSDYCQIDFFIVPPDFAWTMIHTHEDYELGGPYFCRQEWLVPPRENQDPRTGEAPRRRRRPPRRRRL